MCGIAGIMSFDGAAPAHSVLESMAGAMRHRGPDGEGFHINGNVGLVHTRLAIIDLETGDQPFIAEDGTALVGNGEIYNYRELKAEAPQIAYKTNSDCEPPLHLYRSMGREFANRLRGMYALAIHDPGKKRLVISRDPFGIKPLYYAESERGFIFASEPEAILATGWVERKINPRARAALLQLQFTTGRETAFDGIRRVLPGETLVIERGVIVDHIRRPALPEGKPRQLTEGDALERLSAVLTETVEFHQRSDVPYGMFLSGGIDSSALLSLMADLNKTPVQAFTVGFPGTSARDERDHAHAVAKACGAEHREVEFGEPDFWALLPRVAAAVDDPAADYAILPTFKLAETAAQSLKVILSGEGGDELFGGYGRYRSAMRPKLMGGRAMRRKGVFDGLGVLRNDLVGWRDGIAESEAAEGDRGRSRLQVAQAVDCADWLPNDLLTKLDRCLMAHSVEGRVPFLDVAVAEYAYLLPDKLKVRDGLGKWVLRKWLEKRLPISDPFSKKRGFTVPVGEWIAAKGAEIGPLVAAQPGVAEICRPDEVKSLFKSLDSGKRGFAAWVLLFYALWHDRHILGRSSDGDALDVLATG